MQTVSTIEAARGFCRLLAAAQLAPVQVTRRGRPRAVIRSARDFAVVEAILKNARADATAAALEAAMARIARGEHVKAVRLKNAALLLGRVFK